MFSSVLAAVLAASMSGATAPPAPTLCVSGVCGPAPAGDRIASPVVGDQSQPFVWIDADGHRVVTGVLESGQEVLPFADSFVSDCIVVKPSVPLPADRHLRFALRSGEFEWAWSLENLGEIELRRPPGADRLSVDADGYRTGETTLTGASADSVIYLYRLPVVMGTVVDAKTRAPLTGVEIVDTNGEVVSATDDQGRFRYVVARSWPSTLKLTLPGRASQTIPVPKAVTDTDLRTIAMHVGGRVVFTLAPPLGQEPVTWELRRIARGQPDALVAQGKLAPGETHQAIDGIEAGIYRLLISGDSPLQRYAERLNVLDERTTEATIHIQSLVLELETRLGDQVLGDASVEVRHPAGWMSRVTTDAEGRSSEEIWQQGEYLAAVVKRPEVTAWRETKEVSGDGRVRWVFTIPKRTIRGRVLDAKSLEPIGTARVALETDRMVIPTMTGPDGSFEFSAAQPGEQKLVVFKPGYSSSQSWRFELAEDSVLHEVELLVDPVIGRPLTVLDPRGVPIPSAVVFLADGTGVRAVGETTRRDASRSPCDRSTNQRCCSSFRAAVRWHSRDFSLRLVTPPAS